MGVSIKEGKSYVTFFLNKYIYIHISYICVHVYNLFNKKIYICVLRSNRIVDRENV